MQSTYRLPFGGLVARSIGIYIGNLLPFITLAAVTLAPWIVMTFYIESQIDAKRVAEMTPQGLRDWQRSINLQQSVATVLQSLGSNVLTGALTFGVVQKLRGLPAGIDQILGTGVKSFLAVLAVGIVTGLLIGLASLLLIVPGLILTTVWYVALPAAVLERRGVGASMQRSADLTRGNRWPIFGAAILTAVVASGSIFLVIWAYGAEGVPAWLLVAMTLVIAPFGATMPAVCYFMLRMGKENVDAKQVAAVFD